MATKGCHQWAIREQIGDHEAVAIVAREVLVCSSDIVAVEDLAGMGQHEPASPQRRHHAPCERERPEEPAGVLEHA